MAARVPIRVIKRDQRAQLAAVEKGSDEKVSGVEAAARQVKSVVAGWIQDRQQQRVDPRRAFNELFRAA